MMSAMGGRRPTIDDVARHARVSRATAARCLGGYGAVSEKTRLRVLDSARQLGYRPNHLAKSLRSGITRTIGVVIADIANPFFAQSTRGISDVAQVAGYELLLVNTDEDPRIERGAVRALLDKRVDGIIVAAASETHADHLREVAKAGTKMVLFERSVVDLAADLVTYDPQPGMLKVMRELTSAGHTRIIFVTASKDARSTITTTQRRIEVFLDALAREHVVNPETNVYYGAYGVDAARRIVSRLLAERNRPTAMIASDSIIALGMLEAIKDAGLRVAKDVSVVAVDDAPWMRLLKPALSVVELPSYAMGRIAAKTLLSRIEGEAGPPLNVVLQTSLVARKSIGPAE